MPELAKLFLDCPACEKTTATLINEISTKAYVDSFGICDHCGAYFTFDVAAAVLNKKVVSEEELSAALLEG